MIAARFATGLGALALTSAGAAGCALEAGHGFGTVAEASLSAALVPGEARDLGDHTLLTDLAYHVRVERAEIHVQRLALEELRGGGGGGGGRFDPAHPPPGYTLCHGGHCHAEDGRLVDYADIEAELAGGAASFVPIATFEVGTTFDLLTETRVVLGSPSPSHELPPGTIRRVSLAVTTLSIMGEASRGPAGDGLGEERVPLAVELPIRGALTTGVERALDRDHERVIRLQVGLVVDGTLLDGIELAALAGPDRESIVIDVSRPMEAERLVSAFSASEMDVSF